MADVVIAGAAGRMGCRLVALIQDEKDLRMVGAIEAPGHPALLKDAGDIAGVGKIGEVKALPVTLLVQYRFLDARADLRPYVGIGPTYAKFYKARGTATLTGLTGGSPSNPTTLSVESKWALTAQAGFTWRLSGPWQLDGFVAKTALKTRTTLSTGQTLDARIDPWSYSLGVGYRF